MNAWEYDGLTKKQIAFLKHHYLSHSFCPVHRVIHSSFDGCVKCKRNIVVCVKGHIYSALKYESCPVCLNDEKRASRNNVADHYCGKLMYTKEDAKKMVSRSNGKFKGSYYCTDCDAYHVTKHKVTAKRAEWFATHPKKFRNKHV